MKIIEFDTTQGIYHFEIEDIDSGHHAHPVVEIIAVGDGTISIETNGQTFDEITFAILDSNIKHKVSSTGCKAQLLMIESHNELLKEFFISQQLRLTDGIFFEKQHAGIYELLDRVKLFSTENNLKKPQDSRVEKCLSILSKEEVEYEKMIDTLTSQVFLSESRLSHLFKENIGVSIKKYLVWSKLKTAVDLMLTQQLNLTEASLQVGFFDQAHLNHAFKNILGISPSKAYNSRTLQF